MTGTCDQPHTGLTMLGFPPAGRPLSAQDRVLEGRMPQLSVPPIDGSAAAPEGEADDSAYVFKPSLMGPPQTFRAAPDGLEWQVGRYSGRVPYREVRRVRLAYRPANLQTHRFLAEIWAERTPKLKIASVSWASLTEQRRQDAAYNAFIRALHRRLAEARTDTVFNAGSPPWLYWPGVAVFIGVAVAILLLIVRGLQQGAVAGGGLAAVFLAIYLWQVGTFFRRNRPGRYRPDAIPAAVLPSG
jgi:hypothetical protein